MTPVPQILQHLRGVPDLKKRLLTHVPDPDRHEHTGLEIPLRFDAAVDPPRTAAADEVGEEGRPALDRIPGVEVADGNPAHLLLKRHRSKLGRCGESLGAAALTRPREDAVQQAPPFIGRYVLVGHLHTPPRRDEVKAHQPLHTEF